MLFQHKPARRKYSLSNHRLRSRKEQQGVVIVIALFIVALVAGLAYVMISRLDRDTQRTILLVNNTEAEFYAKGSIAWAVSQIRDDWVNQRENRVIDPIPIKSPVNQVNGYQIFSTIYDMQGRFNINNLTKKDGPDDFKRLLLVLLPKLTPQDAQALALAALDWIAVTGESAYDKYYAELARPYRAPHKLMVSPSELLLVKGFTPDIYRTLQPYITALPTPTQTNVQTASVPVLVTLGPTFTVEIAKIIDNIRQQNPFVSTQMFINLDIIKSHPVSADKITVTSNYFLVETQIKKGNQTLVIYTLLERAINQQDKSKAMVNILWESKGIW